MKFCYNNNSYYSSYFYYTNMILPQCGPLGNECLSIFVSFDTPAVDSFDISSMQTIKDARF